MDGIINGFNRNTMFEVGASKKEVFCEIQGIGMLGYGRAGNDAKSVETPLYSRAFAIRSTGQEKLIIFVNIEICFPTVPLKKAVLDQLNRDKADTYSDSSVMITAQHTHSAPGGIAHHVFYNTSIPGHKKIVFDSYVNSILAAIKEAVIKLEPARIRYQKDDFAEKEEVAFNRSLIPYNANKESNQKYKEEEAHLAVDRSMKLLRFETLEGKLIGSINWFGVHTTSVSNDNTKISSDNKGYAATYSEEALNKGNTESDVVTAFAQDAAGDVTPNFIWDKKKKWLRGKFEDDFESARFNGRIQSNKALAILESAKQSKTVKEEIDYLTLFFDMGDVAVNPEYSEGQEGKLTSPACIGMSFFGGTKEGPGVPRPVIRAVDVVISFGRLFEKTVYRAFLSPEGKIALDRKFKAQSPKALAMELGIGRIFLVTRMSRVFFVPDFVDPMVKVFRRLGKAGYLDSGPWGPTVLPLQIMILGQLAIVGIPAEITTIAGERLRKSVLKVLAKRGVEEVILSPYANGYSGYITTHEEYQHQRYEGGHTLFGKWTLAAYQTNFERLAKELLKPEDDRVGSEELYQSLLVEPGKIWTGFE